MWKGAEREQPEELVPSFPSWAMSGMIRSQWIFRAAPDGAHLGYLTPASGMLHVRDRSGGEQTIAGVHGNDWRFSPDGARVAAIVGEGYLRPIVVLDLASGIARELGQSTVADRVEWTRGGVVVRERDPRAATDRQQLTYYPLVGSSRTLLQRRAIHYAAAAASSRVIVFDVARNGQADVLELSVEETGQAMPRALGRVKHVVDAELSPDGRRVAVVTAHGVYLGERGLRRISREKDVSTLWFSSDGARVLFASPRVVTLYDGSRTTTLDAGADRWKSARFFDGGRQVLVAAERSVLRWNPDTNERQTVAAGGDRETILAADRLGEDVVVWTQSPFVSDASRAAPEPRDGARDKSTPWPANR